VRVILKPEVPQPAYSDPDVERGVAAMVGGSNGPTFGEHPRDGAGDRQVPGRNRATGASAPTRSDPVGVRRRSRTLVNFRLARRTN